MDHIYDQLHTSGHRFEADYSRSNKVKIMFCGFNFEPRMKILQGDAFCISSKLSVAGKQFSLIPDWGK